MKRLLVITLLLFGCDGNSNDEIHNEAVEQAMNECDARISKIHDHYLLKMQEMRQYQHSITYD